MPGTVTQRSGFHWRPEWRTALFVAVFVPLFIGLGFWQLQRAAEKRVITASWEQQRQQVPVTLRMLPEAESELAFRPVHLEGRFLSGKTFLLDNRVRKGRYGVEVIMPFEIAQSGELVLVNRGWLPADPTRQTLPDIPEPTGSVQLAGYVYATPGKSYTLGDLSSGEDWPRLVQAVEVPELSKLSGLELFPYLVRLNADSEGALLAEWPLVNARPEKHEAYAVQWFAMAAVLAGLFVWRSSRPGQKTRQQDRSQE